MTPFLQPSTDGVLLRVYVQPKASREGIAGYHGDALTLKIRLKAPPVEGEANAACIRFLASLFGLPQTNLSIKTGHKSRLKLIEMEGVSIEEVKKVIAAQPALSS
ncbi:MAG: YggU family protein [Deltaproteobacteria bacterium]|nr:MAG: YggU family protein [Deltaproteobacteria bacterium]